MNLHVVVMVFQDVVKWRYGEHRQHAHRNVARADIAKPHRIRIHVRIRTQAPRRHLRVQVQPAELVPQLTVRGREGLHRLESVCRL